MTSEDPLPTADLTSTIPENNKFYRGLRAPDWILPSAVTGKTNILGLGFWAVFFDGLAFIVKCEFESGSFVLGSVARLTWLLLDSRGRGFKPSDASVRCPKVPNKVGIWYFLATHSHPK